MSWPSHATVLTVEKRGSAAEENEDYANFQRNQSDAAIVAALADGASDCIYSREWAQLIVAAFVACPFLDGRSLNRALSGLYQQWSTQTSSKELPWYVAMKRQMGSFAALVGLQVDSDGTWRSVAVGDSCLFHISGGELIRPFPITDASAFDRRPILLSSIPAHNDTVVRDLACVNGSWSPRDAFLLLSDALARWFLHRLNDRPWELLLTLSREGDAEARFRQFIDQLRDDQSIRNDDTTCIVVRTDSGNSPA